MARVTTQAELAAAIRAFDPDIQIAANFDIDTQQTIDHSVTISGAEGGPYTLTKADSYDGSLFKVQAAGILTLQNITLDGAREHHTNDGSSLVAVTFGTLILDTGAVLQSNQASEGGGIFASDNAGPITVLVRGAATIRGNHALDRGGGICLYCQHTESSLELSGQAVVEGNTADEVGGGIYGRTYLGSSTLTIKDNASIMRNHAPLGGGVYALGCELTLAGQANLSENNGSAEGGGIYWVGRQFAMGRNCIIAYNHDAGSYGGLYLNPAEPFNIAVHGTFLNNSAYFAGGMCLDAGAAGTLDLSNAQFRENTASTSGGGCVIRSAAPGYPLTITMKETGFSSNQASDSGGGLYSAEGTGRITIRGGSQIEQNHATSGGGIYHAGDRVMVMEGVTIAGNTADTGQGVYNDGPLELGPMAAIPDRLYLPDQEAVPTIVEHLSWNSVVQLERSDYVTPAQDGIPIMVARSDLELVGEDAVVFRTPPAGFAGWRFRVSDDRRKVLLTPAEYGL